MKLILSGQRASLRMLAMLINQGQEEHETVTYSGLSKRLKTLRVDYFKAIYENLIIACGTEFQENDKLNLHRFDSTIINLSGRMIKDGIGRIAGKDIDTQIKVSVGLRNQLPASIRFCLDKSESNENVALIKAINEGKVEKEDILLFDRGLNSVNNLSSLCEEDYKFVTRIKLDRKYALIKKNKIENKENSKNHFLEDVIINLYGSNSSKKVILIANNFRLIKMINSQDNEIWFLTNLFDSSAEEIAEMYKRRWDIEVFFKFIKQNLGYKHFLSHNMNGMQVYIYMILITAVLFLVYKKRCNMSGFKLPLFEFSLKANKSFLKDLLALYGINPESEAVKKYFKEMLI
ncbi:MAG: IS4 family transposase [Candidatus Dependentiae bacterium]|nr:IS4 family transposase [Candidatus Dependentiae bacterium]